MQSARTRAARRCGAIRKADDDDAEDEDETNAKEAEENVEDETFAIDTAAAAAAAAVSTRGLSGDSLIAAPPRAALSSDRHSVSSSAR